MASSLDTKMASLDNASADPAQLVLRLELEAATLKTLKKLDLKNQALAAIPTALSLCGSLEHLDIGGNPLKTLNGLERLPALRILFGKGCPLGPALPPGGPLSKCASLFMLGLGETGLCELDGDAMPPNLNWLILPQNQISVVRRPEKLRGVKKLMLSHNQLDAAAAAALLQAIPGLEMLRVACNRLETLPEAAVTHDHLAWLAIGGNPYTQRQVDTALAAANRSDGGAAFLSDASEVSVEEEELGRGSGAVVRRGTWQGTPVAVKLWSAERFSDGDARGEWVAGRLSGGCEHLVRTLAAWETPSLGMALELLEGASAVGAPPNFDTITRDTFKAGVHAKLTPREAHRVALTVARAGSWLHARGLVHGDMYLHNTLRVPAAKASSSASGRGGGGRGSKRSREAADGAAGDVVRLSDLGAATAYDRSAHPGVERIELRAFGHLVNDLLQWLDGSEGDDAEAVTEQIGAVATQCGAGGTVSTFGEAVQRLEA